MKYVIGSGPAGVACATALLKKGCKVTLIDGGQQLEPNRQKMLDSLRSIDSAQWDPDLIRRMSESVDPNVTGLPMKKAYGSDFPYRGYETFPTEIQNADILSSLAQGGLSNVWGANILPFFEHDISEWPITIGDLAPHYHEVLNFIPYSAERDDIEKILPLYSNGYQPLQLSAQAKLLLTDLGKNRELLRANGLHFGQARLAVRVNARSENRGCVYCGNCLYGCPYQLIFCSSQTLSELKQNQNFSYMGGYAVKKLKEASGFVDITVQNLKSGEYSSLEGDRVFVGCGTVESTRLILNSLELYDQEVMICDSQYFLVPFMRYRGVANVTEESLHTLAQLMIEIVDPAICNRSAHLLVYSYSDLFLRAIQKMTGIFFGLAKFPANVLLNRLMVIQGYLHSDYSPKISTKLVQSQNGSEPKLVLQGLRNRHGEKVVGKIKRRLLKLTREIGGFPMPLMTHMGKPGKSYHAGASFPMQSNPQGLDSDWLGRPAGMSRVHLIDASAFTNIPATNVTLSVMANSHRIGSCFDKEQQCQK